MWEVVSDELISKGVNIIRQSEVIEFELSPEGKKINSLKYKNQDLKLIRRL